MKSVSDSLDITTAQAALAPSLSLVPKKLFIKTYGCQMNVYDSARMTDLLAPLGYQTTENVAEADLAILNTCHIREKASEKVFSELGRLRELREKKKRKNADSDMMLAVTGCVAQAEGAEIQRRAPYVDMVFGPQTYHRLPEMIARVTRSAGRVLETDFPVEDKFDHLPESVTLSGSQASAGSQVSAFVTIQEGCDKFCSFCVVPYTRGAEFSRPVKQILDETRRLVDQGISEINLLGQNVNGFHGEGLDGKSWNLARLLRELADIDGLERLRYTTSHPRDMDEDLIRAHGDTPKIMPYLHLPVQSGSDAILQRMNRGHDRQAYFDLVERLRESCPELVLSSDFIVGYPGESDRDFAQTMDLVERVQYVQTYSFIYSARPGTPAATEDDPVPMAEKSARLSALQSLLRQQQDQFNQSCIGRTLPVLFEKSGRHEGQIVGRSPYLQAVFCQGDADMFGKILPVKINSCGANSLGGQLVTTG